MTQLLITIDTCTDDLWLNHAVNTNPDSQIATIDLRPKNTADRNFPHIYNPLSWRRWLKEHHTNKLLCYDPSQKSLAVCVAAASLHIDITLCITEPPERKHLLSIKTAGRLAKTIDCPTKSIAKQLAKLRLPEKKIKITTWDIQNESFSEQQRLEIRKKIVPHCVNPLILSLARDRHFDTLNKTVWTAAILKHALPKTKLLLAGPVDPARCRWLRQLEEKWNAPEMLIIDNQQTPWPKLAAACDIIIGVGTAPRDIIRILYARNLESKIILTQQYADHLPENYNNIHTVQSTKPRDLAAAIRHMSIQI